MTELPPTETTDAKGQFFRSPWFWSFVLGATVITVLRPCTRYIPDAPEVEAELPAFALVDDAGESIDNDWLTGRVTVIALASPECVNGCGLLHERMSELCERFGDVEAPIELVTLDAGSSQLSEPELSTWAQSQRGECARWRFVSGAWSERSVVLSEGFSVDVSRDPVLSPSTIWLAIVDENGGVRGRYDAHRSEAVDEVYHRTQHVLREQWDDR